MTAPMQAPDRRCTCLRIDCWHEVYGCTEAGLQPGNLCTQCRYHVSTRRCQQCVDLPTME